MFNGCDYVAFRQDFLAAAEVNRWDERTKFRMLWDATRDNAEARI